MEAETKYGKIFIIQENGQKKVDFNKSKFNNTFSIISFLNDKNLTKNLLGY